jgi:Rad3-related DNA helicase
MPLLIACPNCRLEGHLPDEEAGAVIACPACGTEFSPQSALPPQSVSSSVDSLSVWVGPNRPPPSAPVPVAMPIANEHSVSDDAAMPAPAASHPIQVTAENAAAHLDWLRDEVRRFNAHVLDQLELLSKQREEVARLEADASARFVIRTQDLNRRAMELDAREHALDRRAADQEKQLVEERAALGRRADEIDRTEQSLQRRLQEAEELEQVLRGELEAREAEVERQRREVEEALSELRSRPFMATPPPESADPSGHCCG